MPYFFRIAFLNARLVRRFLTHSWVYSRHPNMRIVISSLRRFRRDEHMTLLGNEWFKCPVSLLVCPFSFLFENLSKSPSHTTRGHQELAFNNVYAVDVHLDPSRHASLSCR
jgi:hypothetical protein